MLPAKFSLFESCIEKQNGNRLLSSVASSVRASYSERQTPFSWHPPTTLMPSVTSDAASRWYPKVEKNLLFSMRDFTWWNLPLKRHTLGVHSYCIVWFGDKLSSLCPQFVYLSMGWPLAPTCLGFISDITPSQSPYWSSQCQEATKFSCHLVVLYRVTQPDSKVHICIS